jgi:DNA-directed RNA polymerase sigma subunit (sigma70/sigma32)
VAAHAKVTIDQAKRILHAPRLDSLSTPIGDGTSTVADLIEDTNYSVEDTVLSTMVMHDIETYGLSQLDPRELYVIVRRMGLDREPKQRLSAIGEVLGLSREAVRKIESKARGKLIHPVVLRKMVREGRP